ncbi:conserved protein of unknown function [Rhodovastum atsumiense]|uniref:Uncharacterized protein n=1 Tax=Rhodovastum atsumiense TaxID=504468 RepID=A0A5M6ILJ6_9PROT|nr:DUF1854 domain-containing protein [Rhodovastum atsumiense]KAA5609143.1 hypothetical protein F1189_25560 [Rhodovastum atsumiense]CAH2601249.1 conserved protein of unknown function [Rhodovastum atsumiense]
MNVVFCLPYMGGWGLREIRAALAVMDRLGVESEIKTPDYFIATLQAGGMTEGFVFGGRPNSATTRLLEMRGQRGVLEIGSGPELAIRDPSGNRFAISDPQRADADSYRNGGDYALIAHLCFLGRIPVTLVAGLGSVGTEGAGQWLASHLKQLPRDKEWFEVLEFPPPVDPGCWRGVASWTLG